MPTTHDPRGGTKGRRRALLIVVAIAVVSLLGALAIMVAVPSAFHAEKAQSSVVESAQ